MKKLLFLFGLVAFLFVMPQADAGPPPLDDGSPMISCIVELQATNALVMFAGADLQPAFVVDITIVARAEVDAMPMCATDVLYSGLRSWSIDTGPQPPDECVVQGFSQSTTFILALKNSPWGRCTHLHIDPGLFS